MEYNIDVEFGPGASEIIAEEQLVDEYIKTYREIKSKYSGFFVLGSGYKTNKYHEPVMNFAYNYIKHDDFKKIAKEPVRGYSANGIPISKPVEYEYYLSLWSITCNKICERHNGVFKLKFDHRYKDAKNNDFDGTLFLFINDKNWHDKNLPNNQRYNK